jgi:hypothetical protein
MATLYVLDVPEFAPFVEAAGKVNGVRVSRIGDYVALKAGELRISRKATGLRRAVWYGALTGGFEGRLQRFDDDELVIG